MWNNWFGRAWAAPLLHGKWWIATKNETATHFCSLGTVVHVQTNPIILRILPYKHIITQKFQLHLMAFHIRLVLSTVLWRMKRLRLRSLYYGWYGQTCHKERTAKIMVTPCVAGMVNHAMKNERLRLRSFHIWLVRSTMQWIMKQRRLLTLFIWHVILWLKERRGPGEKSNIMLEETEQLLKRENQGWKQEEHARDVRMPWWWQSSDKYCCSRKGKLEIAL